MLQQVMKYGVWALLLAGVVTLGCTGCKDKLAPAAKQAKGSALANPQYELAQSISLLASTKLLDTVPLDLDVNRAGDGIFVQFLPRETDEFQIIQLGFTEGGQIAPKFQHYASPAQNRAYVRANPVRDECLILDNFQATLQSPVVDTVWRAEQGRREPLNYLTLVPNAASLPPDDCYALEPFYTWDGTSVIVPLKTAGLCLLNTYSGGSKYFAYPPVDFLVVATACQPLPDQAGRRVAVQRWYLGDPTLEVCQIDVLNLDTEAWEASVRTPWPVYEISAQDIVKGPWLLSGSRFPEVASENFRVPRLARVDPATGALDLIEFYGEPYWFVRLDPSGRYVVYMDQQREALVRLNLITGAMDIDKTWYDKEAQLFVSPGAEPVYAWKGNILYRAKWSAHEQHPGLEAE
jgi:hypothetical protein